MQNGGINGGMIVGGIAVNLAEFMADIKVFKQNAAKGDNDINSAKGRNYMARKQNQTIIQITKKLQSLAMTAVTAYEREFEEIIGSRCREKCRIEHTLDGMLDFCFDKNMLEMYRKLCRYYYDINQKSATEYVYAYRDMWDPKGAEKMPRIR